jgi:folate-binding protein YgfZ
VTSLAISDSEYRAATEHCAVLDRSERGKLALTGAEAKTFLQGQVSNDVEALEPGSGCYTAFLTPKGKMLGDVRILDAGLQRLAHSASGLVEPGDAGVVQLHVAHSASGPVQPGDAGVVQLLLLDTERVALQELFNMIRRFSIGYDVQLHKRTLEQGLLSLLGPEASALAGVEDLGPTEDTHVAAEIDGIAVRAIRTDLGVDLLCDAGDTAALLAALTSRGAQPISESVADCLRVERGRPRYGVDLDDTVIPQEADLNERAVSFTKGCYVGQETVARLYYRGKPNRRLRGLRLAADAPSGAEVRLGDRVVGTLRSVAKSPVLGPIALALVRREAPPGSEVTVGSDEVKAVVVELPFET